MLRRAFEVADHHELLQFYRSRPIVLIDEALSAFAEIWAAAGTPNAVFKLTPADLVELTDGRVAAARAA